MTPSRRRLHALSRDPATLTRAVLGVLGFFVLMAVAVGWGRPPGNQGKNWRDLAERGESGGGPKVSLILKEDPVDRTALLRAVRQHARLARTAENPRSWDVDDSLDGPEEGEEDLTGLLSGSKLPASEQALFLKYHETLKAKEPDTAAAVAALRKEMVEGSPALPLTMAGDLLRAGRDYPGALKLYEQAGALTEGLEARRRALDLALIRDWPQVVERLAALESYRSAADAVEDDLPRRLAEYTRDIGGLLLIALEHIREGMENTGLFLLSLLSAAVWFVSMHKACRIPRNQWWISLLGLLLGVGSVALTLVFLLLQESRGGLAQNGSAGNDFIFFVAGVGLREEAAKLIAFLPLLPLLRKRSPGLALVAASCVGLGFALEENLNYYRAGGAVESLGRFVSANFMHLGMTGLLGYSLFRFLRYPKNYGPAFVATFAALVAFHGFYDFCLSGYSVELASLPTFMLVGLGWFYFQTVHAEQDGAPHALSAHAVFLLGSAVLAGCLLNYLVADVGWYPAFILLWPALLSITLTNALFVWFLRDL